MARVESRQFPNLTVLSHPLIQHKLTILRDKRTSTRDFKQLVNEIAMLMAYEVTKDLPLERWYREIRIRRIGEGPSEVQRLIMARDLLGGSFH